MVKREEKEPTLRDTDPKPEPCDDSEANDDPADRPEGRYWPEMGSIVANDDRLRKEER